jgi:hypothetical protein
MDLSEGYSNEGYRNQSQWLERKRIDGIRQNSMRPAGDYTSNGTGNQHRIVKRPEARR